MDLFEFNLGRFGRSLAASVLTAVVERPTPRGTDKLCLLSTGGENKTGY
jgi:hypothetical protein